MHKVLAMKVLRGDTPQQSFNPNMYAMHGTGIDVSVRSDNRSVQMSAHPSAPQVGGGDMLQSGEAWQPNAVDQSAEGWRQTGGPSDSKLHE
jgi:hypothetical protein